MMSPKQSLRMLNKALRRLRRELRATGWNKRGLRTHTGKPLVLRGRFLKPAHRPIAVYYTDFTERP